MSSITFDQLRDQVRKLQPDIKRQKGGGPMPTFLHYANLTIDELFFEDGPICIAKYPEFDRIMLGREGWLQKVRMILIVYDDSPYFNPHG